MDSKPQPLSSQILRALVVLRRARIALAAIFALSIGAYVSVELRAKKQDARFTAELLGRAAGCPKDVPFGVRFFNGTTKAIAEEWFFVHARIPGRSTDLLGPGGQNLTGDAIVEPGQERQWCYSFSLPSAEDLAEGSVVELTIDSIGFKYQGTENLAYADWHFGTPTFRLVPLRVTLLHRESHPTP